MRTVHTSPGGPSGHRTPLAVTLSALALVALSGCPGGLSGLVVAIEPSEPTESDDLVAVVVEWPEHGDDVDVAWWWYQDGQEQTGLGGADRAPAALTSAGQTWTVVGRPLNGDVFGEAAEADVTIGAGDDDDVVDDDDSAVDDDDVVDDDDSTVDDDDVVDDDDSGGDDDDVVVDDDGDGSPAGEDCDDDDDANYPGNTEVCDGQDNDCGADIDEGFDVDGDGETTCGGDCDDADPAVHTTAAEVCDAVDNDCEGGIDEGFDLDGDGVTTCGPDGSAGNADDDCDDDDASNFPGNGEVCDGQDNDCDGTGEDVSDTDGDGVTVCDGDCDDGDPLNFPGNAEVCDGQDNDCGLDVDEGLDADGDGVTPCGPDGLAGTADDDCDDSDPSIHAGATEVCDGVDQNCVGGIDDGFDVDLDGLTSCAGDCDDGDPDNYLGNIEVCDGQDNDCGGDLDEGFDVDGDGVTTCGPDGVAATADDDCDDAEADNFPGNAEVCDGQDNDCSGDLDEGFDGDRDGVTACGPDGLDGTGDDDCDDDDPALHPLAGELLNGHDDDCDGLVDEDDPDFAAPGMGFQLLYPGTFTMGCVAGRDDVAGGCYAAESPSHPVTLTRYLWMAETETTQAQWEGLMGNNPSHFGPGGAGADCGSDCPVEGVNHYEALAFTNAMSSAEGLAECYALTGCTGAPGEGMDCSSVTVTATTGSVYDCEGYRLPTEAEWEYAARGGEGWPYPGSDVVGDVARYDATSGSSTHPVGLLQANAWGLLDMSGNVWEWTWDRYEWDWYASSPGSDPTGATSSPYRVKRGGAWNNSAADVRAATRSSDWPDYLSGEVGLRVVRSLPCLPDADGDGFCDLIDCDDADPLVNPVADEVLNGLDDDCDGLVDGDDPDFPVPGMGFELLDPGSFTMGCVAGRDDLLSYCTLHDTPPHPVHLTRFLWMATTETTQDQWEVLMGNNPSHFGPNGAGTDCGGDCPVESVNWFEAATYANAMSAAEGVADCYALSGCTGAVGAGLDCSTVSVTSASGSVYDCEGYRIPTEAEWEYAARAGEDWLFAGSGVLGDVGWTDANSGGTTQPVGLLLDNAWGLHDMTGNVEEWVWDWFGWNWYSLSPTVDPAGSTTVQVRVFRGDHWGSTYPNSSRISFRDAGAPETAGSKQGFRLARSLPCLPDADGDGFCDVIDCDDTDPLTGPLAEEVLNGLDDDCDGLVDGDDPDFPIPGMGFVLLTPDTFTMGCVAGRDDVAGGCFANESPSHTVTLTQNVWMAQTETTQAQWQALMGNNPSYFGPNGAGDDCGDDCPVETVNWYEALAFANALSTEEGLAECYALSGCTNTPGNDLECTTVTVTSGSVYDCEGYRLPTEAEWEHAARGGEDWPYPGSHLVGDVSRYLGNAGGATWPTGQLQANDLDLYDMSGNVREWTWDWFSSTWYSSSLGSDPTGPASGTHRVDRGGSWDHSAQEVRAAYRHGNLPGNRGGSLGFRVVRSAP